MKVPVSVKGRVRHYAWGKVWGESLVARVVAQTEGQDCHYDRNERYAELWFGAHPSAPSEIVGTSQNLRQFLEVEREFLWGNSGDAHDQLPFLLKVISVAEPLSIQVHPNRQFAEKLHLRDPHNYPDSNPKPEMAYALTDVTLLADFRDPGQISAFLYSVPELAQLLGISDLDEFLVGGLSSEVVQGCLLGRLCNSTDIDRQRLMTILLDRLRVECSGRQLSELEEHLLSAARYYDTSDVGLWFFFFLNLVKLRPGQVFGIEPHTVHAYLCGDLIECLANSDNVVRAGLTSKYTDFETLLEIVKCSRAEVGGLIQPVSKANSQWLEYELASGTIGLAVSNGTFESASLPITKFEDPVPCMLFCLEGRAVISSDGQQFPLNKGEAMLFPVDLLSVSIDCERAALFLVYSKESF